MNVQSFLKTSATALGVAAVSYTVGAVLAVVFAVSPFLMEVEKAKQHRR